MFKFFVILSTAALLVSSPALAQNETAVPSAETAKIVPLIKMTKPELRIVFTKQSVEPVEDEVIAHGTKIKPDMNVSNPVICKDLKVPEIGEYGNASRLKKKPQEYCNHRSQWDIKERNIQKMVKNLTGM